MSPPGRDTGRWRHGVYKYAILFQNLYNEHVLKWEKRQLLCLIIRRIPTWLKNLILVFKLCIDSSSTTSCLYGHFFARYYNFPKRLQFQKRGKWRLVTSPCPRNYKKGRAWNLFQVPEPIYRDTAI